VRGVPRLLSLLHGLIFRWRVSVRHKRHYGHRKELRESKVLSINVTHPRRSITALPGVRVATFPLSYVVVIHRTDAR